MIWYFISSPSFSFLDIQILLLWQQKYKFQILVEKLPKTTMLMCNSIKGSAVVLIIVLMATTINADNIRNSAGWNDPFCSTWNLDGSCCQKCSYHYYMDKGGRCQVVSDFCKTWDEKTGWCTSCFPSYGNPVNGVCPGTPVNNGGNTGGNDYNDNNCVVYGYIDAKNKWYTTFVYGCKKVCKVCRQGYYLNTNFQCKLLTSNCLAADSYGNCIKCVQGYQISNGLCIASEDHCDVYGWIDGKNRWYATFITGCRKVCKICDEGYYLDTKYTCQPLSANCLDADQYGNCEKCIEGYQFKNGVCVAIIVDDHCALYGYIDGNNKWYSAYFDGCRKVCKVCDAGYYLDTKYKCQPLSANCLAADKYGNCIKCVQGYQVKNSICVAVIVDGHCAQYAWIDANNNWYNSFIAGCRKVCKICDEGYYLDSKYTCQPLPANCLDADRYGNCQKCIQGYEVQNGVCVAIVVDDNCAVYGYIDNNNKWYVSFVTGCKRVCKLCEPGFYLDINYSCRPLPANCLSADKYGNCIKCLDRYEVTNGLCVAIVVIDHCAQYGYIGADNRWYHVWMNDCRRVCKLCQYGYYLDSNYHCQPLPANCLSADQNGKCTSCASGYVLKQGVCVQNDNCQIYGYVDDHNKWYGTYNDQGKKVCKKCKQGYYLGYFYKCWPLPGNCLAADIDGHCTDCIQGYHVENGICVIENDNCKQYGYVDGNNKWGISWFDGCKRVCKECNAGYYLDNNYKCQLLSSNCLQADKNGKCTKCVNGYQVQNGVCVVIVFEDHCKQYGYIDLDRKWYSNYIDGCRKVCKDCDQGYYLDYNYKCRPLTDNCQEADVYGKCTECEQGYQVQDGLCVTIVVDNHCAEYGYMDDGKKWYSIYFPGCKKVCKKCDPGYYLDYDNDCLQLSSNCLAADPNGHCTKCVTGYRVVNGICIFKGKNNKY